MADLTTLAKVKTFLGITDASKDDLINLLIPAVSAAVETYCNRFFIVDDYAGYQWSEGGPILYLQNIPVLQIKRVVCETLEALDIRCDSALATSATVEVDKVQDKLHLVVFGDTGSESIEIAAKTLSELKTAIEAVAPVGRWSADLQTDGDKKASELIPIAGLDALNYDALLELFDEPIDDFEITRETGRLERRCGNFPTQKNVYVEYRAGYADIDSLPPDLCQLVTQIVADAVREASIDRNYKSERWPDYQYTLADVQELGVLNMKRYESQLSFWRRIAL